MKIWIRVSLLLLASISGFTSVRAAEIEVTSLDELARASALNGQQIRLKPGVYRMADYLTEETLAAIRASVDHTQRRPAVVVFCFRGNDNRIDFTGSTIEVDTGIYERLPHGGYNRCFGLYGSGNTLVGLNVRSKGAKKMGGGGTMLCVFGERNTLEDLVFQLEGSSPFGYGDLLGKGGPNLVPLQKQSGIQVFGSGTLLRRCKVLSRALGHCFYIQGGDNIRFEDCHAEGLMRSTDEMLGDSSGPAFDLGFKSVYENRDGRYVITPGYMKALTEDGFRTYGGAGSVTLVNCVAINTRGGFEIGARDDASSKTIVEGCSARGCERAFLIGSNTIVRRCSGDMTYGPLLYLRGGHDSDVDIELVGDSPKSLVHVVATLAGENHKVHLRAQSGKTSLPSRPILLGFGMPEHAEMSSPIRPAPAKGIHLINEIGSAIVISSEVVTASKIETTGRSFKDAELRVSPGSWGLPPSGIAGDTSSSKK